MLHACGEAFLKTLFNFPYSSIYFVSHFNIWSSFFSGWIALIFQICSSLSLCKLFYIIKLHYRSLSEGCPIQQEFRVPLHSTRWCSMWRILWNSKIILHNSKEGVIPIAVHPACDDSLSLLSTFFLIPHFCGHVVFVAIF